MTADYLLSAARDAQQDLHGAPRNGRFTIWVDDEEIPTASGATAGQRGRVDDDQSTNGVPIIVERAMWWPGPSGPNFWSEAHNSPGATATGTRWALAEGEVGGPHERRDLHLDREHVGRRAAARG